ncbi:MAG: helix-turn-helix domain-containing protein [Verrucomicrobia bacterium]|nr:helix-turn-helix domain-containing protein [Verrucomicrobiota bacterium]
MIALEDIVQAALLAPPDRKKEALRVLRGEIPAADAAPSLPPLEPYLTLKEVAKRLGLDPSTLWRWQVPGHDLGGRRRFRLHEVVAYLESDLFKSRVSALRATRRTTKSTTP